MKLLALVAAAASGAAMTVQSAINSALGKMVGLVSATFVVHAVGLLISALILVVAGSYRHLLGMGGVPVLLWTGGLLGVFIVFTMAFTVARLGTGLAAALVVTTQLLVALVCDHFGWLGLPRVPVTWLRLAGAALLLTGAWLLKASTRP